VSIRQVFENKSSEILSKAVHVLQSARLKSYEAEGSETVWACMGSLLEVAERCLREKNGLPMIKYAETLACQRYNAGYGLHELQTAFNSLEEALWEQMMMDVEPTEFLAAMGMVSSIIGMGKDAVARKYVELSSDSVVLAGESWSISKNPAERSTLSRSKPGNVLRVVEPRK
jgi:hypothetical protein